MAQCEEELKRENGGVLPPKPRSLIEQIEELIQQQRQASLASEPASRAPQRRYLTKKQVADFKGMTRQVDQISALVSICQQEFQLQPNFVYE